MFKTLNVMPTFTESPTPLKYLVINESPEMNEYSPKGMQEILCDLRRRSGPFVAPFLVIPIVGTRKRDLTLLLNTLDLSYTFENDILILATDESCRARISLVFLVIGDYCDHGYKCELKYWVPEIGQASPRTLFLDTHDTKTECSRILNYGLGFVHVLRPRTPEEVNSLIARISDLTDAKYLPDIRTLLGRTTTGTSILARGFSKEIFRKFRRLMKTCVIKPADKGGRTVVMSKAFYKNAVMKLLLKNKDYMIVERTGILERLVETVNRTHSLINKTCKSLRSNTQPTGNPRLGFFYGLPKIHKSSSNPPMRPVVSQINHPTFNLAKFLDDKCKYKLYAHNAHILKSTLHTLGELRDLDGTNQKLVTFDVSSLYTSIPLGDGIRRFKNESNKWFVGNPAMRIAVSHILPAVLYNNYFMFDDVVYKQTCGVAMGSPLGPLFANTYMLHVDREIMRIEGVTKYLRYIDDVFMLIDDKINTEELTKKINSVNKNIVFELGDQGNKVVFLDTTLHISEAGKIEHCIYEKPISATSRYIHVNSLHPRHCLEGVITGSIKRAFRLCTSKFSALLFIKTLNIRFRQQGVSDRTFAAKLREVIRNRDRIRDRTGRERIVCRAHKEMQMERLVLKDLITSNAQWVYKDYFSLKKQLVRARFKSQ